MFEGRLLQQKIGNLTARISSGYSVSYLRAFLDSTLIATIFLSDFGVANKHLGLIL